VTPERGAPPVRSDRSRQPNVMILVTAGHDGRPGRRCPVPFRRWRTTRTR